MPVSHCLSIAVVLFLSGLAGAFAAEAPENPDEEALWEWRLAAFGRYGTAYPASEDTQLNIVPLPFPVYRGRFLRLGEDSENPIRGRIFRTDRIKLDFAFDLNFPVDSDDVDARTDMPDLDLLLEVGPELEWEFLRPAPWNGKWYFGLQLRPAVSFDGLDPTYRGLVFAPELTYRKRLGEGKDTLKLHVTPTFATSKYMDYFYTVDTAFATPARPAYQADGGYLGTDLSLSWRNKIDDKLETMVGMRVSFHQGAANRDSPLFTQDTTFAVYAAVTWKFWEGERRVPTTDSLP